MNTIKIGYESSRNISFKGELDTGISQEDWARMSEKEQNEAIQDVSAELVDLYVIED